MPCRSAADGGDENLARRIFQTAVSSPTFPTTRAVFMQDQDLPVDGTIRSILPSGLSPATQAVARGDAEASSRDAEMDVNRNQYFMFGVVILILGIQFRYVDSFVLNEKSSQFISERLKKKSAASPASEPDAPISQAGIGIGGGSRQIVRPPKWLSWALISVGVVLILHSLAMKKPD